MGLFSSIGKAIKKVASPVLSIAGAATGQPWLSAAGTAIGGFMQNQATAKAASNANAMTERMMQNRHQWEVNDLMSAGLNPVLSANGTPSMGSSAVADVPSNPGADANSAAMAMRLQNAQLKNMEADTRQKQSSSDLNDNLGAKTFEERKLVKINQAVAASNASSAALQAQILGTQITGAKNEQRYEKSWYGRNLRYLDRGVKALSPFANSSAKHLEPNN